VKKVIYTDKAPEPIGPYNQAILAGGTLYISGQIAIDPESGELKIDDIESETRLVMKHLGSILQAADMDYSNLVKCSIFIKDMGQFELINKVYGGFFYNNPPARETVEVAKLPKGVNVEISAIAVR